MVQAGGSNGGRASAGANEQSALSCNLSPIAVKSSVLNGVSLEQLITDLTTGTPSGHEGWLTWAGGVSEGTLATSLTPPGDSDRYVNPDDRTDHVLSIGDWVSARPGAVSSRAFEMRSTI